MRRLAIALVAAALLAALAGGIAVAAVGCSVFAYDYLALDFVEAPHGRAPAVATGERSIAVLTFANVTQEAADDWPVSDLFLVAHRALREVPRVRVVWDLLVERLGADARRK